MSDKRRKKRKSSKKLAVIGWREWVSLPDLPLPHIKAKIDSGARSSSIDACQIETFERDDEDWVRFRVRPQQRSRETSSVLEAPLLEIRSVRSSNGVVTKRPVIETDIELHGQRWPIELTLADRDLMGFQMLLGRQAFRGRFLLDAGKSYCGKR